MTKEEWYRYMDVAGKEVLAWAAERGIPLARVEYVTAFGDTDFRLSAWMFYKTEHNVAISEASGITAEVKSAFLAILEEAGYAPDWLGKVFFVFDSCENVDRNYEGNYYYRMK